MSRADATALLAALPEAQRRAVVAYLLDLVHELNAPTSTVHLELYSARQTLDAADLDDPTAALDELGEITDNLEAALAKLRALVDALAEAANKARST